MFSCKVCGIACSGVENYQQHLASAKHKKKALAQQALSPASQNSVAEAPTPVTPCSTPDSIPCTVCGITLNGLFNYTVHVNSSQHAVMVQARNSSIGSQEEMDGLSESSYSSRASSLNTTLKCIPCGKEFTGREPFAQHLASEKHARKTGVAFTPSVNVDSIKESAIGSFYCDVCNSTTSGRSNFEQHLRGSAHKKKLLYRQKADLDSVDGALHQFAGGLKSQFFCETCKMDCSGPIPYNSHITGEVHKKNVNKANIEQALKYIKLSKTCTNEMMDADSTTVIQNTTRDLLSDHLLMDDIVTLENVTVFKVDEPIHF